jgi:hypothetical protein
VNSPSPDHVEESALRIMTAHRILIATAIVFFVMYALWETAGMRDGSGSLVRAALAGAGAAGLAFYFKTLPRSLEK